MQRRSRVFELDKQASFGEDKPEEIVLIKAFVGGNGF